MAGDVERLNGMQLQYATIVPWHRRRRVRGLIVLLVFLTVAALGIKFRVPITNRARLLYWQDRCMNWQRPANLYVVGNPASHGQLPDLAPVSTDEELIASTFNFNGLFQQPPARCSKDWDEFATRAGLFPSPRREVILFLHQRKLGDKQRLVVVRGNFWGTPNGVPPTFSVFATVVEPGTIWRAPRVLSNASRDWNNSINFRADGQLLVHAGQCDRNDPSRFTITCTEHGRSIKLIGQLQSDDTVTLTADRS